MKADVPGIAANNLDMPALGFGTFELDPDTVRKILPEALDLGYRHIDTAQIYGNEAAVGDAIAGSSVARKDVFLTTKVWVDQFGPDDLLRSVHESLEKLRCDRVDLLLLHWPVFADTGMGPTLEALMRARSDGLTRHIGLSNFTIAQTEQAVAFCGEGQLATNQVDTTSTSASSVCAVFWPTQSGSHRLHALAKAQTSMTRCSGKIDHATARTAAQVARAGWSNRIGLPR